MAALLKRGKNWYSNFPARVYTPSGEVKRDPRGRVVYTKVRWALSSDKRIAQDKNSDLEKIRNAADDLGISFFAHYKARAVSATGGSWSAFTDQWIRKRKLDNKQKTWDHDQRAVRDFNRTAIAIGQPAVHMAQVTPKLLDAVRLKWIEEKRRPSAINRAIRSIKHIMRAAAGFGDAPIHAWEMVKKTEGETDHREHFYTSEEIKKMLRRLPLPYKTAVMLGARNGRRPGECFYLPWTGVDLKNRTLRNVEIPGHWKPKTKKSAQATPMEDDLYLYMRALRKRSSGEEWVISGQKGSRTDLRSFWVQFVKYLRKMGIKKGSGHTLRHTFASHLVQDGADLYSVSKLLRHSSIKQTERYAHLRPPDLMRAARRLRRL